VTADGGRTSWTGGGGGTSGPGGIPGLDDAPLPTCYRHPGRETGVSCFECGRPICPDCMTAGAVGFRCPECMAQQRRGTGRARVVTRGQTRDRWQGGLMGGRGMSVTKVLVAVNVAVFIFEFVFGAASVAGGGGTSSLTNIGALRPYLVVEQQEYWRLVTSMFLHAGVIHLLFNMWALWVVGEYLETVLGRLRFLIVYFVSGLAGSAFIMVASDPVSATVGASGAIFGVFGALAVYSYINRARDLAARMLLRSMVIVIAINLVITMVGASIISWQGHLGGLLGGAAVTGALLLGGRRDGRERLDMIDVVIAVAAVALLVAIVWWRIVAFPPPPYA